MGQFLRFLARRFPLNPYARVLRANQDLAGSQERALRRLLRKAQHTEFGRQHDFSGALRSAHLVRAYQERVPLCTDADMRPQLDRMLQGEADVLWPGKTSFGAKSGGTTSHGQMYPIGMDCVKDTEQFCLCSPISYVAERGDIRFLQGKVLGLAGLVQPNPQYNGLLTGEFSGITAHRAMRGKKPPSWMAVPPRMDPHLSWEDRVADAAERSLEQDIRFILCSAGWGVHFLRTVLSLAREKSPRRPDTIAELWPNLRLIQTGAFPLSDYRHAYDELIGSPTVELRESYGATQASMAFQDLGNDPAMQLWVGGDQFYEFVPWENFGAPHPPRLTLAELQPEALYVPYVSTCAGLWSFGIEDIVRFSSVRPPRLHVVGRTGEMLDIVGEGILREQAQTSVEQACRATDALVNEFHMSAQCATSEHGVGHQLLVEFERPPIGLGNFVEAFDTALQAANAKYRLWRQERDFALPELVVLPPGTFYQWLLSTRNEVGSQTKIPRLKEQRSVADALLRLAREAETGTALAGEQQATRTDSGKLQI